MRNQIAVSGRIIKIEQGIHHDYVIESEILCGKFLLPATGR
jgi:hypothetical protein